ncbi:MAG: patatin-like phospholipase family protein, partial [Alphaproteobacteria bacterium]
TTAHTPQDTSGKLGVGISCGGAHGVAFLGMLKAYNDRGLLNDIKALSGSSAGAVIASFIGSVVNTGIIEGRGDIQTLIDEGIQQTYQHFKNAAINGSRAGLQHGNGRFLAASFKAMAAMSPVKIHDPLNGWHLEQFPNYLNPEAVSDGPIDVYIGLTEVGKKTQHASVVAQNDTRPEVLAASCAINTSINIGGEHFEDGGNSKAAPISALIKLSGCSRVLMVGETHDTMNSSLARHQSQSVIANRSAHAAAHFQEHARYIERAFPHILVDYAGVSLPDCDDSRSDISLSSFDHLFESGERAGIAKLNSGTSDQTLETDQLSLATYP